MPDDVEKFLRISAAPTREEAIQEFDRVMAARPSAQDEAEARLALGFAFELRPPTAIRSMADHTRDAAEQYRVALGIHGPHRSRAHHRLAHIERLMHNSEASELHLREALRAARTSSDAVFAWESLIRLLIQTRRVDEASTAVMKQRRLLRRAMRRSPRGVHTRPEGAMLLHNLAGFGRKAYARKLIRKRISEIMRLPDQIHRAAFRELCGWQSMSAGYGSSLKKFGGLPVAVDLSDIEVLFSPGSHVTPELLRAHGLLSDPDATLHLTAAEPADGHFIIRAHSFTRSAVKRIRESGGAVCRIHHRKQ